jgi:hypothetical protein
MGRLVSTEGDEMDAERVEARVSAPASLFFFFFAFSGRALGWLV